MISGTLSYRLYVSTMNRDYVRYVRCSYAGAPVGLHSGAVVGPLQRSYKHRVSVGFMGGRRGASWQPCQNDVPECGAETFATNAWRLGCDLACLFRMPLQPQYANAARKLLAWVMSFHSYAY